LDNYVIRRRNAWKDPDDLSAAAERSSKVGAEMTDDIRWIRSYIVDEDDGTLGSHCIYQATSVDAIRTHADRAGMPADEITPLAELVIINPDP
jgi:hypothetical protein